MEAISEQRLAQVYPGLADKVRQMADALAKEGILIRVTQGLRTVAEQCALYAQGRTKPGSKVTNCPGGHSWHNFGLAVDCCPSKNGLDQPYAPDWNTSSPAWKRMIAAGAAAGLSCGAHWIHFQDMPHFQLTGRWPVGTPPAAALALIDQGLDSVWAAAFAKETV